MKSSCFRGPYAPPVTPLIPASCSDRLDNCLDLYAISVSGFEKYSTLIISREFQRECEGTSSSEFILAIYLAGGLES